MGTAIGRSEPQLEKGTWESGVESAAAQRGETHLIEPFVSRLPPGYRERTTPDEAASDLHELVGLATADHEDPSDRFGGAHRFAVRPELARSASAPAATFRLRRFGARAVELTGLLPVLESFGLIVIEAVPFWLPAGPNGEKEVHIDDFSFRIAPFTQDGPVDFDPFVDGDRLLASVHAVTRRWCDVDSLNRLVVAAGLGWSEVVILRAYRRYLRQVVMPSSDAQLEAALVAFPSVANALYGYFAARFDPHRGSRSDALLSAREQVLRVLDEVPDLEQDRVLRTYLALIDATMRTNAFIGSTAPRRRPHSLVSFKLESGRVPNLPRPLPYVEVWTHGPDVEGIHLRFGPVARGGIRWSTRSRDVRVEVLDLAMAQVKKNAIIVPTGAKGGFVCRGGEGPTPKAIRAAYQAFVGSLLEITDNLVDGISISPEDVVCHDGPDPYLVVAADKGTATFSDLANSMSEARGFWLGDAFASGGSHGYDHKLMGITAKGAWVAVRHHFHELDINVQTESIRVAGIGDMSGDVFGNGMLRSQAIYLVAAFDHRHIFLDPNPDPVVSYEERERLATLERSSWADYDPAVISKGGGVWSREEKQIPLSVEVRKALGTDAEALAPPELVSAILAAPVDLLWFGGIGTYVKASGESDLDVGDHANDGVRISADRLRARVIAEGANLGITQRARISYSRRGGRINTDFIDNAAGVATSDQEVNLKILLAQAIEADRLDPNQRDKVLADCEADVATAVLRQVGHSVAALNRAVPQSAVDLDAYEALLESLENVGRLDRAVEHLPSVEEFARRREANAGLIRPELAVLLAYAKSELAAAVEHSDLVDDPSLAEIVGDYFPERVYLLFGDLMRSHPLYPQLLASSLSGEIVNRMGIAWANETAAELGRTPAEVAGAFWAARSVLEAGSSWRETDEASVQLGADAERDLHHLVADSVEGLARSYLRRDQVIHPSSRIAEDRQMLGELHTAGRGILTGDAPEKNSAATEIERAIAARHASFPRVGHLAGLWDVARTTGRPLATVLDVSNGIGKQSGVDRLASLVKRIPSLTRWGSWQARAVLDGLADWHSEATQRALLETPEELPGQVVERWYQRRVNPLAEVAGLISALEPTRSDALIVATLTLARLVRCR